MRPIEAIGRMLEQTGTPKKALADELGRSAPSISNMFRLASSDMKVSTLLGACSCTGYRMLLVSENGDLIEIDPPTPKPGSESNAPHPHP